jgi:hypothetical protein
MLEAGVVTNLFVMPVMGGKLPPRFVTLDGVVDMNSTMK